MYNYISEEVEFGSSLRVRELSPFLKRCDTEVYSNKAHYVLMQHWIIKQLCTVPVVKGSCDIVAESHMTPLWSSNGAKHWVGVDHRAAVRVCAHFWGDYPLHNPRKQTDSICQSLCLDEVIMHGAELQAHLTSTNTHAVEHEHTNRRTLAWVSMATPNKQSVHVVTQLQQKEKGRNQDWEAKTEVKVR